MPDSKPEEVGELTEALEVYDSLFLSSAGLEGASTDPLVAFEVVLVREAVGLALALPVLLDTEYARVRGLFATSGNDCLFSSTGLAGAELR